MSLNIKEIIAATRDYNFHSHTQFCDGREPMEAMAAAAVAEGLTHYGFTPHSPICGL
ncbi:MAG: PHP domain-containing protein [Duncaniella sp.]|nr:PHP domain-containing protein [Duncaniella sp.]